MVSGAVGVGWQLGLCISASVNTERGRPSDLLKRTSSTMADAGLKISTAALALTFAVMLAANVDFCCVVVGV